LTWEAGTSRRSEASEGLAMEPTMEAGVETAEETKALGAVVQIDEGRYERTWMKWCGRR
jgi:hypothetical protein